MSEVEPRSEEEPQIYTTEKAPDIKWKEAEENLEKYGGLEGGIKETVIGLNVFDIETVNSCEGHFNHGRIAPWVSIEKWESKPKERFLGQKEFEDTVYEKLGVAELNRNYSEYLREFDRRRAEILGPDRVEPDSEEVGKQISEIHTEIEKQFGITPEITKKWMETGMQVDKEVEEAGKDGRLQETEEYKQWKAENDAMKDKVQKLLDGFYKDREVAEEIKIIIDQDGTGSWCIHNGGKDYYDVTRKPEDITDKEKKHYQKILDGKNSKKEQKDTEKRIEKYQEEFEEFTEFLRVLS